jgi:streptogramin lyase
MRFGIAATLFLASAGMAQDAYWVANRTSNTLSLVRPWGQVAQTVNTTTNLRRVVVAPDGKLWVVRFIQAQFDIHDASGAFLTTVTNPTGSVYDVAFDKFGHAWVSGGSQIHEYDANGVLQPTTYAVTAAAPLGISVDADGNKWIAHRVSPGVLSRIDATTGAVTSYPVNAVGMMPTVAFSDYRGVGVSSHIWVIGDSSGQVAEFDVTGTQLNTFSSTITSISSFAQDFVTGDYFIGSFGATGPIARMTPAGVVSTVITNGGACLGLNFDSFGRLLVTTRFTAPVLSEVRRWNISSPALEVIATVGTATQSAASTRRDFALLVDPLGDADGDGISNNAEIFGGTSPWDPQSNALTSMNTVGPTASGSTFGISVFAPAAASTAIAAAGGTVSPGLVFAGFNGALFLDPALLILDPVTTSPILFLTSGTTVLPIGIPPGFAGTLAFIQGATVDVTGAYFTNLTGLYVYL